jgi:hypothetical protein
MGLYNGAMGTVKAFLFNGNEPENDNIQTKDFYKLSDEQREIPIVLVEMDGNDFKHSVSSTMKNLIPFYAKAGQCTIKDKYIRYQLPLLPAFARTAHSVQGVTAHHGVVVECVEHDYLDSFLWTDEFRQDCCSTPTRYQT